MVLGLYGGILNTAAFSSASNLAGTNVSPMRTRKEVPAKRAGSRKELTVSPPAYAFLNLSVGCRYQIFSKVSKYSQKSAV